MTAKGVNTSLTSEETHCLDCHEIENVNIAAATSSVSISSAEVARQIKTATDPLADAVGKTLRPHGSAL